MNTCWWKKKLATVIFSLMRENFSFTNVINLNAPYSRRLRLYIKLTISFFCQWQECRQRWAEDYCFLAFCHAIFMVVYIQESENYHSIWTLSLVNNLHEIRSIYSKYLIYVYILCFVSVISTQNCCGCIYRYISFPIV